MKIKTWPLWCLFLFAACQSDADRLREGERRFLKILAPAEKIVLTAGSDTLFLPMLPSREETLQSKTDATTLQAYLQKIDKRALGTPELKRLDALSRATSDLATQGVAVSMEQFGRQMTAPFTRALEIDKPLLTRKLVEYLPEYVSQLEQRWPMVPVGARSEIVQAASESYDLLQKLQIGASPDQEMKFQAARRAWKDYIGLCQSGYLAGN